MRRAGNLGAERDRHTLVRLHRQDDLVRLDTDGSVGLKREVRHGLQGHRDLRDLAGEPLAGAEIDRHAGPAPVVHLETQGHVGLCLGVRRNLVLLEVPDGILPLRHARRVLGPHHGVWPRRLDRVQHLHLLVADLVGLERHRRLHAQQGQQLKHVVLDEVAQRTGPVVVLGATADAEVLRGGDLHVVDEVAVPDRLEHAVRKAKGQHVLDGLLAEVVVDPEDLGLVEDGQQLVVELVGLLQARAEWLLDHHPHIGFFVLVQPVVTELLDDPGEEVRGGGEVEDAVERDPGLLVERAELVLQPLEHGVDVERPGDVAHVLEQLREHLLVRLPSRVLLDRLAGHLAVLVVRHLRTRDSDQIEALRERALVCEVVDRRQQLAVREVSRRSEDHERGRVDRQPLESLDERVLLGDRHPPTPRAAAAVPPGRRRPPRGRRTGCAARRSPSPRMRSGRARRSARRARP